MPLLPWLIPRRLLEHGSGGLRWLGRLAHNLREASSESGTGIGPMLRDLVFLNATTQVGVRAYFQYRLFDRRLTLAQKAEYLPDSHWATRRFWQLLNPHHYRLPFANKLVFNRVFGGAGLPVA